MIEALIRLIVAVAIASVLATASATWEAAMSRNAITVAQGRASAPTSPPRSRVPSIAAAQRWARRELGATEYRCLYSLVQRESRWRVNATNRRSGAYGLPQALPGSKMARYGRDWRTNPLTQLRWMVVYVRARYGGACRAWRHALEKGWY